MGRILAAWVIAALLFCLPAPCCAWTGKVIGVADGDTITVLRNGQPEKIRLWGIDCPEKNQDFETKAKHVTSILVFAKVVDIDPVTVDRYGRTVAFVKVGDTVVNEELIRQGLARVFTRYCDRPICERWEHIEAEAREEKRGLWSMPNAISPWEFRRSGK
ncbi:MAG TPA: thermonuclease family protein [Syntrophobacteria bacterium]|nr:thermonuclease family protein [Syntrophobacteria bacterium]